MSVLEIEQKFKKIQQKIEKSRLAPTCIHLVKTFGEKQNTSSDPEYPTSELKFEDDGISLSLFTYAMGDEEIKVFSSNKMVFKANEITKEQKSPYYPKVTVDKKTYEIETYLPGDWEAKIESLRWKSEKPFPVTELEVLKSKFPL